MRRSVGERKGCTAADKESHKEAEEGITERPDRPRCGIKRRDRPTGQSDLATRKTLCEAAKSCCAMARPSPRLAPVTMNTLDILTLLCVSRARHCWIRQIKTCGLGSSKSYSHLGTTKLCIWRGCLLVWAVRLFCHGGALRGIPASGLYCVIISIPGTYRSILVLRGIYFTTTQSVLTGSALSTSCPIRKA